MGSSLVFKTIVNPVNIFNPEQQPHRE